jgi:hypothetical protein
LNKPVDSLFGNDCDHHLLVIHGDLSGVFAIPVKLEKGGSVVMKQKIFPMVVLFLYLLTWTLPVNAAELHPITVSGDKTLFSDDNVTIPSHDFIDHVVDIGGNVTLGGNVHEIIVIGGNLHIQKTAHVRDMILVIGGSITEESGASITESLFHLAFDQQVLNSLLLTGTSLFGLWFFQLSSSLLLMILPICTVTFWKKRVDSFVQPIRLEFKRLMLIGIATSLLLIAVSCLLTISIIGISFLVIFILLVIVFSIICLTAVSLMIGEQFPFAQERQPWLNTVIGSALVVALLNFPLIGLFFLLGLHWLSLGLLTSWLWEKRLALFKRKK